MRDDDPIAGNTGLFLATAGCTGADHEQRADALQARHRLTEDDKTDCGGNGGFDAHQNAERGRRHAPQREHFEYVGQERHEYREICGVNQLSGGADGHRFAQDQTAW